MCFLIANKRCWESFLFYSIFLFPDAAFDFFFSFPRPSFDSALDGRKKSFGTSFFLSPALPSTPLWMGGKKLWN
jgi:hypothetical protein